MISIRQVLFVTFDQFFFLINTISITIFSYGPSNFVSSSEVSVSGVSMGWVGGNWGFSVDVRGGLGAVWCTF
jgi:hypothetical protein